MTGRELIESAAGLSTATELCCYRMPEKQGRYLYREAWRGTRKPPERLLTELELVRFLLENPSPVVALRRKDRPLEGLFLHESDESALVVPFVSPRTGAVTGMISLTSPFPFAFSGTCIQRIEQLVARAQPLEVKA
jgi:hypothetical protein